MVNPHNITCVQLGLQIALRASGQHEDLFSLRCESDILDFKDGPITFFMEGNNCKIFNKEKLLDEILFSTLFEDK